MCSQDINNTPEIKELDSRKFLTNEEFEKFNKKLEHSFYEAAKLIPEFDSEKIAITNEQIKNILPFLYSSYTPYEYNMMQLRRAMDECTLQNSLCLYENHLKSEGLSQG